VAVAENQEPFLRVQAQRDGNSRWSRDAVTFAVPPGLNTWTVWVGLTSCHDVTNVANTALTYRQPGR
jgi:hypothetical protein